MIVQIVVAALLSLAVAPAMQAQTEGERKAAEREAEWKAKMRAEYRAESEASVRFTLRLNGERHRLQLIEADMCESYRVRAKAIERTEREWARLKVIERTSGNEWGFPSSYRAHIDLEEFPMMAASWHKEREASCRESVQRLQDYRESDKREISAYQSGEKPRCCGAYRLGSGFRTQQVLLLYGSAMLLCQQGRDQLHVKASADAMLKDSILAGIGMLDQKAGSLAQAVVDMDCPLLDKYASWARDVDPDFAAALLGN